MYEFITIGGGEYFVDIFNGLAMLVKSGDYLNVVQIAASLAFMIAVLNATLSGSLYDSSKWFLMTFIITQTLLYPKATVQVTDKTNPALMGATIDNVPFVIAYTASTTSKISYALTKQFESVYSLPNDLQYTENGMIFGVNLWQAMQQTKITNSNLAASIDSFSQNCIFFDIEYKIYSFDDLKNSDDIWTFIKERQVENRFFTYTNNAGETSYPTCKAGAASLDADWEKQYLDPNLLQNIGFSSSKPSLTKSVLSSATPLLTDYFFQVSKTSEQVLQQAMMVNAINAAVENYEAENQIQSYQNARAALQTKSTFQTMGTQAGMWIPILKIVIEVVFYGAFPLVILVSLIPGMTGMVLRGYFTTFFWLAAWGPIYTILHRISMGHGATYTIGLGKSFGLTLANQPALEQTMSDMAAMAGYMSMFVPMLAFGIARGGAAAMSSMTTSFMSGVQGAASAAAHEGTTGNLSFGNVSMGQRHAYSGVSIMNDAGQVINRHNDGSSSIDNSAAESRLGFDVKGSERVAGEYSTQMSNEQSLGQTKSVQATQTQAHGFEMMINNHRAIENSNEYGSSITKDQREAFSEINRKSEEFSDTHQVTRARGAEAMVSATLGLGGIVGADGKISTRAEDMELYNAAKSFSEENNLSKEFAVVKSAVQSNRFNFTDSKGESINESFNKAASLNKEASQHFDNAKRYSEQLQYVRSHSVEIDRSYNQELWGDLVARHGTFDAAKITNPSSSNKTFLNQEISRFIENKVEGINNIQKPNLEEEYNNNSKGFVVSNSADKVINNNPYQFSSNYQQINNSNLQNSVPQQINKTQQIISDARIDSSPKDIVQGEQEKGVLHGVIDNSIEAGRQVINDVSTAAQELKLRHLENKNSE